MSCSSILQELFTDFSLNSGKIDTLIKLLILNSLISELMFENYDKHYTEIYYNFQTFI